MPTVHLARHAIYNLNGKVYGYELLFRGDNGFDKEITSNLMATSKVLLNLLTHMDFDKVIGEGKRAFINMDHEVIFSGIVGLLKPERYCIEISPLTEVSERLISTLEKMRKRGFLLALDDFDGKKEFDRFKPILHLMHYVKFYSPGIPALTEKKLLKNMQERGIKTMAYKLQTHEQYREAVAMKHDLFQGFHVKKPEVLEMEIPTETTRSAILHMVALIKEDKETADIEAYAKTQPDLAYNLIKYLNSPMVAPAQEIQNIRQAIAMIGRNKLIRWLLVYLYSESAGDDINPNLIRNALNRAEKMEDAFLNKQEKEKAYLTGMFSLLDVVFNTSMSIIVRGLPVDNEILSALISKAGPYGKVLRDIEESERQELLELVNSNFGNLNTGDVMKMLNNNNVDLGALIRKK